MKPAAFRKTNLAETLAVVLVALVMVVVVMLMVL